MMKRYEEYKTSELPWIKEIPTLWPVTKIRTLFAERSSKVSDKQYPPLSVGKMGVVPQLSSAIKSENSDDRKLICKGDFAINSRSDRKGSSGLSEYTGSSSLIILVLYPIWKIYSKYYNYLFHCNEFVEEFYRNGRGLVSDLWTTRWNDMKNILVPIPSLPEQNKIVRYLDYKTAEMDRFIKEKKREIELLEEYRRGIVDKAVTKGLHKNRNWKNTSAKWMGIVPAEWNSFRLKNVVKEINVRSEDGLETHLTMSQKKGLVTDNEINEKHLLSESYVGAKICEKDDLVLNRLKAHLGVFAIANIKGVVSSDYTVLRINKEKVFPKYLELLMKSDSCRRELVTRVKGIVEGFWRLYTEDLYMIHISLPSLSEQQEILEYLQTKDEKIQQAISSINSEISLVEELRTKLISDVVTGQVDVRDEQIPA